MRPTDPELRPTIGDPQHEPAQSCNEFCDPDCVHCTEAVRWDLSFGANLSFGPESVGGSLVVHLSLSDDALTSGQVHREVTRTQLVAFARHLLALTKGPDDIETSVAKLNETIALLDEHIYAKADEIASERIADARRRTLETVNGLTGRYQADRQRWADLEVELRRQLDVQLRQVDVLRKRLRDAGLDPNTGLPAHEPTREQP
jgi:hypothetical protein